MNTAQPPVWRSMLFVPATVERFVEKAHTRGADAIIIDLEDATPAAERPRARSLFPDIAKRVSQNGADVAVRINRPWRDGILDLEAVIGPDVDALVLPKTPNAEYVRFIAEIIDELETERGMTVGTTRLIPMVESPDSFFEARAIAAASPRVAAMTLGMEDFSLDMRMSSTPESLLHPLSQLAIAARAAGAAPLGVVGSLGQFADLDAYRESVRHAHAIGFEGAFCIHPAQVKVLNETFAATEAEIASAEGIVAAFDAALAEGRASTQFEGKMIDAPVYQRAKRLLARCDVIAARS